MAIASTSSPSTSTNHNHPTAIYGRGSPARYVPFDEQSSEDLNWMREALKMAQEAFAANEVPVGSVFVRNGKIICRARNRTNELMNVSRVQYSRQRQGTGVTRKREREKRS